MIFIIKSFQTIIFIFISANMSSGFLQVFVELWKTLTELRTTSFIESTGVAYSDSVSYNRVQVLSIPVLLLACSQDWTCNLQMIVSLEASGTNVSIQSWLQASNNTGILDTCTLLWLTESEQATPWIQ